MKIIIFRIKIVHLAMQHAMKPESGMEAKL
jgi:hypothetical protein